jgi:hypothetical protein
VVFCFNFELDLYQVEVWRYSSHNGYPYIRKGGRRGIREKNLQNLDSINYEHKTNMVGILFEKVSKVTVTTYLWLTANNLSILLAILKSSALTELSSTNPTNISYDGTGSSIILHFS